MKRRLAIIAGLLLVSTAHAGDMTAVSVSELDTAIDDVITQPEYAWRMPREKDPATAETGFWAAFFDHITEWAKGVLRPVWRPVKKLLKRLWKVMKKVGRWLRELLERDRRPGKSRTGWQNWVRVLLFAVLAGALSFLAILLLRIWRGRIKRTTRTSALVRPTRSDILEEKVAADELPMDEWMAIAREFLDNGELRLAVRAMFLGCLVFLANREKLTIARHKSNREYIRELDRKAHDAPDVLLAFAENVKILERLWYGMHRATQDMITAFTNNQERIFGTQPPSLAEGAPGE